MTTTTRVTVLSAGLRNPSSTTALAERLGDAVARRLGGSGPVDTTYVEVREHAHAVVDALLTGFPAGDLKAALAAVTDADALVLVTPTFQGSYSGLFKSFLDLVEPGSLRGRPVLLAATGGSERHSLVIDHALRPLMAYHGALVVPTGVYAATGDFGGSGAAALQERIERAAGELTGILGGRPEHARVDEFAAVTPFEQLLAQVGR